MALVGLMIIQVYWIRNAVAVKEAHFMRSVDDAVSNVIIQLEKIEINHQLNQQMEFRKQSNKLLQKLDSINQAYYNELAGITNYQEYKDLVNRSLMAQSMIQEIFNPPMPRVLEQRLSGLLLDSLIKAELQRKGINTEFEFGVYTPSSNKMLIQKTGKYPWELLNKSFVFALYPSDMQLETSYLMVYFPREKQFLIGQLWGLLLISVVLIFMIIFAFTMSINTIFRQKKLSEMKNDFINNMTHEFKTPISTISLACEALSDKDVQKSESLYNNYINIISEENKRLGKMSEKVLQSAILDKGKFSLKKEWLNIHEIIIDVIQKIGIQVERKNGKITTDFKAETHVVHADKMHITNVIYNLLDNANKYTPLNPLISVSTSNMNSSICISIQDNGIGISHANQQKVFQKLYRIPTGNVHNFKGFGLGLSYVKAIVEKHGGSIGLESELRKGSKFNVYLPLEAYKTS